MLFNKKCPFCQCKIKNNDLNPMTFWCHNCNFDDKFCKEISKFNIELDSQNNISDYSIWIPKNEIYGSYKNLHNKFGIHLFSSNEKNSQHTIIQDTEFHHIYSPDENIIMVNLFFPLKYPVIKSSIKIINKLLKYEKSAFT